MSFPHPELFKRPDAASTTSAVATPEVFDRISNKVLSFIKEGVRSRQVGLRYGSVTTALFPEWVRAPRNARIHVDTLLGSL